MDIEPKASQWSNNYEEIVSFFHHLRLCFGVTAMNAMLSRFVLAVYIINIPRTRKKNNQGISSKN